MPDRLHWIIDKPRLLRRVLRLVPRWRPTLTIVNLSRAPLRTGGMMVGRTAAMHGTTGSAEEMARGNAGIIIFGIGGMLWMQMLSGRY